MLDPRSPVLVGVGVAMQREEDARDAREPLDLMIAAARAAGEDCGAPKLLAHVGRVAVPQGRWRYRNPGGAIARAIGASRSVSVLATVGVLQQTLIGDACLRIANGELDAALVAGGDAGYRLLRARIAGVDAPDRNQDEAPEVTLAPHEELLHEAEIDAGIRMPVALYAILESAYRASRRWSVDAHRDRLATMLARMSEIAEANPHAWRRKRVAAAEIRGPSSRNPMQAFPYTKLHCATWNVDQAAALLFCSTAKADALGIPPGRRIHAIASSESNHMVPVTARDDLARCPGAEIAGRAALDAGGLRGEELALVDLYSCFPVAVETYADALGIDHACDLTVTGGMPFAGGPYNNYVLQATARMATLLRERTEGTGLVTSVSGLLTKQGFGLWGRAPAPSGFAHIDATDAVARDAGKRHVARAYRGPAVVAGYTVVHAPPAPPRALVVADLPDGRRALAKSDDASIVATLESREFCGAAVVLDASGAFVTSA